MSEPSEATGFLDTAWCTVEDVTKLTGITITEAQLTQAQAQIDIATGRSMDAAPTLCNGDLRWLRLATAYQAAWMAAQPDLFTRTEVESYSQDGASGQLKDGALTLAPLARRALRNVSWRRHRVIRTSTRLRSGYLLNGPIVDVEGERWTPIGGR